jgi:DeoR family transcriptional regulator, fructose operon transcriptional repressor
MTVEERQLRVKEYIEKVEFASLDELSKHADVSISTVRRDLNTLEEAGSIRRTHGGARLVNPKSDEFTFTTRDTHEIDEKEVMGRACASLVRTGETVIMDAGTTVYHVAKYLQDRNIQVVTNSLPVANLFLSAQRMEVVVTGGVIYPRLGVLVGPLAVKSFSEIHADVAIMSAGGITLDGLTNSHALLIEIQRAMMKSAGRLIFCLDHTKFGRKSVAFLCGLDSRPTILTDSAVPADLVEALRGRGLEVLIASADGSLSGNGLAKSVAEQSEQASETNGLETSSVSVKLPERVEEGTTVGLVGLD